MVDTQSVYNAYAQVGIDYNAVLQFLSDGFELMCVSAYSNYFDPGYGDHLRNIGFQVHERRCGHQYDLVRDTIELFKYYETVILFSEEYYVRYLKEEAAKKGAYLFHMGRSGNIEVPETVYRRRG